MKVIKRDGRVQEFSKDKIYTSLYNAAQNTDKGNLNESDVRIVADDIYKKLISLRKEDECTSSYEINGVIINVLLNDGFSEVLKTYLNY